ncbi:MAG: NAD-dependent epimerase/dehydratase family protein, partial [Myxococcota bacterium]|nr:NAD-dependent epimerase/dehydratase family protein [Myxococcota bacterium]
MPAKVLVVGGAGYIGSLCNAIMRAKGLETVTYDDLSTGHAEAVQGELVVGDIRDRSHLER